MTHVLHVVDALALGGAERMVVEIANRTLFDGHRASVCVTRTATAMAPKLDPRVELVVLGRQRRFELRPLARLASWCATNAVDVVHCHGRSSFSLVAILAAARQIKQPIVMHDHLGVHGHPEVPGWFRVAKRYLSAYVAVDEAQLAWAQRANILADRTHVIANAFDTTALEAQPITGAQLAVREGWQRVICVGGIRNDKAIDVLLEAFALVRARAVLHIVGGDADVAYATRCRERARAPDLADRVVFEGQRDDALALARTADLAVHSARSESGPLVVAEYAALGVPFVSTQVGGVASALADAGVGRFVAREDVRALAGAIDELLALPAEQRREVGKGASVAARRKFDIAVAMPHWYRLYAQLEQQ